MFTATIDKATILYCYRSTICLLLYGAVQLDVNPNYLKNEHQLCITFFHTENHTGPLQITLDRSEPFSTREPTHGTVNNRIIDKRSKLLSMSGADTKWDDTCLFPLSCTTAYRQERDVQVSSRCWTEVWTHQHPYLPKLCLILHGVACSSN